MTENINKVDDIIKFFHRENMYRVLKITLSMLVGGDVMDFKLLPYGGSYMTQDNLIVVGLMDFLYKLSFKELYVTILAMLAHEAQHYLSTSMKDYHQFIMEETEKMAKQGINRRYARSLSSYIGNAVEDGRIEIIASNRYRGFKAKFQFLNILIRDNGELTEDDNVLHVIQASILTISKLNLLPKGYNESFKGTNVDNIINEIRPLILEAHKQRTSKECFNVCSEIVDILIPLIKKENDNLEKNRDLIETLLDSLEDFIQDGNFSSSDDEMTNDNSEITIYIPLKEEGNKEENKDEGEGGKQGQKLGQAEDEEHQHQHEDEGKIEDEKHQGEGSKDDEVGSNASVGDEESGEYKEEKDDSVNNEDSSTKKDNQGREGDSEKGKDAEGDEAQDSDSSENKESEDSQDTESDDYEFSNIEEGIEDMAQDLEEEYIKEMMREIGNSLDKETSEIFERVERNELKAKKNKKENTKDLNNKDIKDILKNSSSTGIGFLETKRSYSLDHDLIPELKISSRKFKRDIEKIFLNRNTASVNRQEKGVLNPDDIFRVAMDDYNVFSIEGRKAKSDYVIYVLKDGSGSMHGEKELSAGYALTIIEEGLKGLVPLKLVNFNTGYRQVLHHEIKDFDEKDKKNYSYNFLQNIKASGGNTDDVSISIATEELLRRPERDKVLIILSDGLPDSVKDTKNAVKEARMKKIHLVGIMFGAESFRKEHYSTYKYMYETNIISTSPNMIPKKLTETLKKILVR